MMSYSTLARLSFLLVDCFLDDLPYFPLAWRSAQAEALSIVTSTLSENVRMLDASDRGGFVKCWLTM